jgi:hypothetical protein
MYTQKPIVQGYREGLGKICFEGFELVEQMMDVINQVERGKNNVSPKTEGNIILK